MTQRIEEIVDSKIGIHGPALHFNDYKRVGLFLTATDICLLKKELTQLEANHQEELRRVREEENERCAQVVADKVLDLRNEDGTPRSRYVKLAAALQVLTQPSEISSKDND